MTTSHLFDQDKTARYKRRKRCAAMAELRCWLILAQDMFKTRCHHFVSFGGVAKGNQYNKSIIMYKSAN